jgi:shikimate dehydrogenase
VLGSPIAHSLSPTLHRAAYASLGLTSWTYTAIECDEAGLPERLRALADDGLAGVSLTMPLKRTVMPLLAEVDGWATTVEAANTVVFGDEGWRGANTDVPGMVAVLREAGAAPDPMGPPWVLGAGATAGSALAALAELGHQEVFVAARRVEVGEALRPQAARLGLALHVRPWTASADVGGIWASPLVVATTPAGATDVLATTGPGQPAVPGLLIEVLYSPWPTPLAAAWQASGGRVVGGLELLVEQAVEQVVLMTGQRPDPAPMRTAGYAAMS